ncbi:WapI family immunity protein [Actinoplanes sp. CA-054009]
MRLRSVDGAGIELRPVAYEFDAADGDEWDDNWLVVRGEVGDRAFDDPCLTTWEARELGAWLRGGGRGEPPEFVEPNLAFDVADREGEEVLLRVRLSAETGEETLLLRLSVDDMVKAAGEWEAECGAFPER